MNSSKVVVVLLIICGQDSHNDPEEMVSKVDIEDDLLQIKMRDIEYEIDSFRQEENKRMHFGWHTRDKPFHLQNFRREIIWHRIRSRCF
ncbi:MULTISPECIES: hypothetical protein [Bacteroides]|jgi:hypothetical protein|uniref:hypothetical protein n=1 Tax=Bacteroides TaxID=816 RepID=UPI0011EE81DD|nr:MULTISPECIES: hypothetical protein [Bacteroides]KAA0083006.1 hypothetical protein FIB20_25640 [Bacteroides thetaiotaomicron]KAA0098272.1 hypothetical protein FIA61_25695 [Bacteroides thetaiotaomicron]MCS2282241.1 hypothetical protein [Bacteroides thetaiotaomicron]